MINILFMILFTMQSNREFQANSENLKGVHLVVYNNTNEHKHIFIMGNIDRNYFKYDVDLPHNYRISKDLFNVEEKYIGKVCGYSFSFGFGMCLVISLFVIGIIKSS